MRVLLVSQYYEPEVGATQNRMRSFAEALACAGHEVTVVCEQPNHPDGIFQDGYGRRPVMRAHAGRVRVYRLWVATSPTKTTTRRLLFYGTFAAGAATAVTVFPRHDVIMASSPPLPGVLAAAAAATLRRTPLIVDVRDIWPAAAEALGELSDPRLIRLFERAERWLYRTAAVVTATTTPFCHHVDRVAGCTTSLHLPNGALDALVELPVRRPPVGETFRIGYFGNFGIAQGLDVALDAARALRGEPFEFVLVGGGPLGERLRARVRHEALNNVHIRAGVPPSHVGELMLECNALLVPLRSHSLLGDFIPSKVYDAAAVGRPVLVAARGEVARFVDMHKIGFVVAPEDGKALAQAARRLRADPTSAASMELTAKGVGRSHARSAIAAQFVAAVEAVGRGASPQRLHGRT